MLRWSPRGHHPARAGYRKGLGDALKAHGDKVTGEFTSIDAVAAEVHCDDLAALARMSATASVSVNAPMEPHGESQEKLELGE